MTSASSPLSVAFVGLGPIGRSALSHALLRPSLQVSGACDQDPAIAGRPLAQVVSGAPPDLIISRSIEELCSQSKARVIVLCTQSRIESITPSLELLVKAGRHVVSSSEELVYPQLQHAQFAERMDRMAQTHSVAVLGAGVNPGFVLDFLPVALSGVCFRVERVRLLRIVDTRTRRGALQLKVGAGLTPAEFRERARRGQLGHVGLPESAAMICASLGWGRPKIEQTLEPVLAEQEIETPHVKVTPGGAVGQDQRLIAVTPHGQVEMSLRMYLGAEDPRDEIHLEGEPPIDCRIPGGIAGDVATIAILLNAALALPRLPPGLRTMLDCPPPACRMFA